MQLLGEMFTCTLKNTADITPIGKDNFDQTVLCELEPDNNQVRL